MNLRDQNCKKRSRKQILVSYIDELSRCPESENTWVIQPNSTDSILPIRVPVCRIYHSSGRRYNTLLAANYPSHSYSDTPKRLTAITFGPSFSLTANFAANNLHLRVLIGSWIILEEKVRVASLCSLVPTRITSLEETISAFNSRKYEQVHEGQTSGRVLSRSHHLACCKRIYKNSCVAMSGGRAD